ncbi:hypothetical protein ID866_400 [Astraeus odoratus]|nr:hypothetical protein ID866_400 [Astraeus odoratus]
MAGRSGPLAERPPRSAHSVASVPSNSTRQQHQQTSLAKRLLFPHLPPGADLPPLFASTACPPELHAEVYDFIALALRAHVNTWWTKITRYDKEFLPQLNDILTHVIRVLEQRLLGADLPAFAFCDIPALVNEHYIDYRHAVSKVSTSYATGGAHAVHQLFHQLQPHLAVSAEGEIDEEYFRHALDLVLRICLPAEDYTPEAERYIVREILLKLVVTDVIPRVTQPWYIQKTVLDLLGLPPEKSSVIPSDHPSSNHHGHVSQLSHWIVLFLSAVQSVSGACLALIHAYNALAFDFIFMVCSFFRTFINNLLSYMLYDQVLSAPSMLRIVRLSKRTLFPNGYPGPPPVDPGPEEQLVIRQQLIRRVSEMLPGPVSALLLGPMPVASLNAIIDPLSNHACNVHLAVFVFDTILVTVFPELCGEGPAEMEASGVDTVADRLEESEVEEVPSPSCKLTSALATFIVKAQKESIEKKGRFTVALSGGSLPKQLKGLIGDPAVKWDKWQVFYADERVVPLDHPDSNHNLCQTELFQHVPIPPANIHTLSEEFLDDLEDLSDAYEKELIREFAQKDSARFPVFDLILLGIGPDGHTCSLFPGHELLTEEDTLLQQ